MRVDDVADCVVTLSRWVDIQQLPIGTVLAVPGERLASGELDVSSAIARAPWCPVCLTVDPTTPAADLISLIPRWPRRLAVAITVGRIGKVSTEAVCQAVAERPYPPAAALARYVVQRSNAPELLEPVAWCFSEDPVKHAKSPSRSWLSRHLSRFGPFSAKDWMKLGNLLRIHSALWIAARSMTIDGVAWAAGMDPRTLRKWCRSYIAITPDSLLQHPGWESVLEFALRKGGYVRD